MGNHLLLLMSVEGVVIDFVDLKHCVACVCVSHQPSGVTELRKYYRLLQNCTVGLRVRSKE